MNPQLTDRQREVLRTVLAATSRGEWYRGGTGGERHTLESLYARGTLERQVFGKSKSWTEYEYKVSTKIIGFAS